MEFAEVAVLGTGMMGPGIAASVALGGAAATVVSRTPDGARRGAEAARGCLDYLARVELITPAEQAEAAGRIAASSSLAEAVAAADLVIESVPEEMPLKQALFERLDGLCRADAVLASNTSGLSLTEIAARCGRSGRVLTTHFWNPPHLMPLVEIVCGARTDLAAADRVRRFLIRCGKVPVLVRKDRPGQLGNRMHMALVREAVNIVAEGIADAEDVDLAARLGFGLRLPAYGVLEHQDVVGLELGRAVCDYVARDLYNEPQAPPLYAEKLAAGATGAAGGRGFHDWSVRSIDAVKARRDRFIVECLRAGVHRQA